MANIIRITNLIDLQFTLNEFLKDDYIYRGISKEEEIFPKILREECAEKELIILKEFERYYGIYATAHNFWEFVSAAQHYGLMTRLIDFTSNPYVALFFSLHGAPHDSVRYKIYCLPKRDTQDLFCNSFNSIFEINSEGHVTVTEPSNKNSFTSIFGFAIEKLKEKQSSVIYTLQPNIGNNRLLMQQGLFVLPIILEKERIREQLESYSRILEIDSCLREEALVFLDKLGYNEFRLMPDLDSVSREINRKIKNMP